MSKPDESSHGKKNVNSSAADRWARLSVLFDAVIELPPDRREAYIESACAGDTDLEQQLRRMLTADIEAESDGFLAAAVLPLDAAAVESDTGDYSPGSRRFGAYVLLHPIGRGGMGEVHLAARSDGEFEQRVALKLLPHPTAGLKRRFLQERQILARLEHPNIARLLDGGVGEAGVPYFAMEYVEGAPIDRFVYERELSVRAILKLFLPVCDAVQYAHRNLVIHRDIKPSNILVGDDGAPKLLDFGIAKILQETEDDATQTQARVFTPDYAAPEQIRGDAVTTATDVYTLGVLLYELLTGARPYKLKRDGSLQHAILTLNPSPPSAASERRADTRRARLLRGDVDRIVMTALAKEPERRYSSAEALARDVRAYLDGRPVAARGDSPIYRFRKFVSRHRASLAAAVVVAAALIAATVVSALQAHRAAVQAQRTEAIKDFLVGVFEENDPDQKQGKKISAEELLDHGAKRLEETLSSQPALQAELLDTVARLYDKLGSFDRASALLKRSLAVQSAQGAQASAPYAATLAELASIDVELDRYDQAEPALREALATTTRTLGERAQQTADISRQLGGMLVLRGKIDEAKALLERALAIDGAGGAENSRVGDDYYYLAMEESHSQSAGAQAIAFADKALATYRRVNGPDHSSTSNAEKLVTSLLLAKSRYREAETVARDTLRIDEKIYGDSHPSTLAAKQLLGTILYQQRRPFDAEAPLRDVLEHQRTALGVDHYETIKTALLVARIELVHGHQALAEQHAREQLALTAGIRGGHSLAAADAWYTLGAILAAQDRANDALDAMQKSLALQSELMGEHSASVYRSRYARFLVDLGYYDDALAIVGHTAAQTEEMYGGSSRQAVDAMATQADAELGIGDIDAARAGYVKVMGNAQKIFADQPALMSQLQLGYARVLHAAADDTAASKLLNQALQADLTAFGEDSLPVANDRLQMAAGQCAEDQCDEAHKTAVAAQATIAALLGSQHRRARDAAELVGITLGRSRERAKVWNVGMLNARRLPHSAS